jgi:shikimate dehydrogenase
MPDDPQKRDYDVTSPALDTWLVGLLGRGIAGSRSRQMHEREASALRMQLVYRLIDFDSVGLKDSDLGKMIAMAETLGFAGVNVTHPYKQAVIAHLDSLAPNAAALGAVNTVRFSNGKRTGHNTNWSGFASLVQTHIGADPRGKIAQIGAGGAGSATAYALLRSGADVAIYDPEPGKAAELATRLSPLFADRRISAASSPEAAIDGATGITQTSPVGMAAHPGLPFDPGLLCAGQWLIDIIYFPAETELVQAAKARGVRAIGGSGMAVYQAARAFEIFTGVSPDTARMLGDFEQAL